MRYRLRHGLPHRDCAQRQRSSQEPHSGQRRHPGPWGTLPLQPRLLSKQSSGFLTVTDDERDDGSTLLGSGATALRSPLRGFPPSGCFSAPLPRAPPPPFPAPSPPGRHHAALGSRRERRAESDGRALRAGLGPSGGTRAVGIRCPRRFRGRPPLLLLLPTRSRQQRRRKPSAGLRAAPVFLKPELLGGKGAPICRGSSALLCSALLARV